MGRKPKFRTKLRNGLQAIGRRPERCVDVMYGTLMAAVIVPCLYVFAQVAAI